MAIKVRNAVFAILQDDKGQVMLVANRRSQGGYRWSFPGGLVDKGETSLEALTREVKEETSISVTQWDCLAYTTVVQFRNGNRDLDLNVEIHLAKDWEGTFDCSHDPDGLVKDAIFIDMLSAGDLYLGDDYISEPKLEWALSQWDHPVNFIYRVDGRGENRSIRRIKADS
tara:strand:+ start:404 stop:913 length:510 start_codon:yes stop_codon:yes gene_type:complete